MSEINMSVRNQIIHGLNDGSITIEALEIKLNHGDFAYDPELEGIIYDIVSHGW